MVSKLLRGIFRTTVVMSVAAALALSGCAGMNNNFNVSADDACHAERAELKSFQDYFFRSMVEGAAAGAVAGGLAGALISGNLKGAAIGAGAGAVVGGVGGYFLAKQKATSDPNQLTQSVYQDVSTENAQIDKVTAAFDRLRDCRFRTARAVKADLAAGRIARPDAQTKLAQIRKLFQEDIDFAESLGAKMNERGSEYQNASTEVLKLQPNAAPAPAAQSSGGAAAPAGSLVADVAARVRSEPSATGKQIASLTPGEAVSVASGGTSAADWTHVQLKDGRDGYVASRLLRPAGSAPTHTRVAAKPASNAAGVAQLTETNQLKRKALNDDVAEAKASSNSAFDVDGKISRLPHGEDGLLQPA